MKKSLKTFLFRRKKISYFSMAYNNRKNTSSGHGVVTFNSYMTAAKTTTAVTAATNVNSKKKIKQTYWTPLESGKRQTPQMCLNPPAKMREVKEEITATRGKEVPATKISFPFMQRGQLCIEEAFLSKNLFKMEMPTVEIPDEKDQRFCVLSYEQVKRLNDLMSDVISIHGRGNFPTIDVKLCDLVSVVRRKLEEDGVHVKEIRLNGSGASSVLAADNAQIFYNDLDLIFSVDLTTGKAYERVKSAVLDALLELLPEGVSRKRMSSCSLKEAYVSKMVKVNDTDRWSLITLGNNRSKTVELKFVNSMKRQYEFSVDSFHIMLDTLFLFYECSAETPIGDNFYPTVVAESMYGDFHEALYHLHKKLIATKNPEEIRGGGLLKYCNLLCKDYQPASPAEVKTTERYMCSRFFIDFPDVNQQRAKLENYLYNHFQSSEDRLKYEYLMILYQVVDESTVCLMGHERRLTLSMIEDMAFSVYCPPPYYPLVEPPEDPNLLSPVSSSSFSSASSTCSGMSTGSTTPCSSGQATPQKPPTPAPMHHQIQVHHHSPPPPPLQIHVQTTATPIPTYEIVTSCQPAVVYANGYYYTSFLQPATMMTTTAPVAAQPAPCMACSCNQWIIQQQPQQHHQQQQQQQHHIQPQMQLQPHQMMSQQHQCS